MARDVNLTVKTINSKYPWHLVEIPRDQWPRDRMPVATRLRFLRSRDFMVQVFEVDEQVLRMSVNRTEVIGQRFKDGITWDELQSLKKQAGYGDRDAVEVYPADRDLVDVANMRHLFIFKNTAPFSFIWRKENLLSERPAVAAVEEAGHE